MANGLVGEASPYLLQHADNPVDWRPYGEAAFAEAKALDRPILLSIGYAACHWCHVMAHESFEDSETARLMNALFVNVKVDREERPDVDHIYMSALHALGGQGGWPLTMFVTPDGAPFFGGTYWPPERRWGRPGFRDVLAAVDNAWREKRASLEEQGAALIAHLREEARPDPGALSPGALTQVGEGLLRLVDRVHAGIGTAPKFPNAPIFRFFWSEYFRRGDARFRDATRALLDALCQGGIYDHLGGGFARYSTDAQWHVPHFEKMLYDNAQILDLLALAHSDAPSPLLAARAAETVDWLQREMIAHGAFAASLDADSEGEEGRFYVWSAADVDTALGADAAAFKAAYDVRDEGNWEGVNVLRRLAPFGDEADERALARSRATLLGLREKRPRPALDDKILADWNGWMIAALARASSVFARPDWLALAESAFAFVDKTLRRPDGRLVHSWREGRLGPDAMLDDVAAMALAALRLFEAGGDPARLGAAIAFAEAALSDFADADGGVTIVAANARDAPIVRPRHADDGATPSGVGVLAETLATLWHITEAPIWRERAERLIQAFSGGEVSRSPLLLAAADILERGGSIGIEAALGDQVGDGLWRAALGGADPGMSVVRIDPANPPAALSGRPRAPFAPSAMVCRGGACSAPTADAATLRALIRSD